MVTLNKQNPEASDNSKKNEVVQEASQTKMITVKDSKTNDMMGELSDALIEVEQLKELNDKIVHQREKEFKEYNEAIIDKLNKLYDATNGLRVKIEHAGSYEKYIEERMKSTSLEHDVVMLQNQLSKEKLEFSTFINIAQSKIEELKTADDIINKSFTDFIEKMKDNYKKYIENVDNRLNNFGKDAQEKYTGIYDALKKNSQTLISEYVSNCKQNTDTMKNATIDFLKDCKVQNSELIKKIPVVNANKYNLKEIFLYILSAMGIICLLINLISDLF